ncbi:MAG TPA: DNA-binding protein [Desulfotomaculum sp.]|nr:DNA-binding protein [Desulfotomaculum sp.]HCJ78998.1 DNA-binding protein [Desulfotomaculum sp.]
MTKLELIREISSKADITQKVAGRVIDAMLEVIQEAAGRGDNVRILGFGAFLVRQRAERQGRNIRTGEAITIPAKKVVVFKPGKNLREAVNQNED